MQGDIKLIDLIIEGSGRPYSIFQPESDIDELGKNKARFNFVK